jgi:hypothetical protein
VAGRRRAAPARSLPSLSFCIQGRPRGRAPAADHPEVG